jgi:uncharacterized protein (TIGR02186 family)
MSRARAVGPALLALALLCAPAQAEKLIVSVSSHRVLISSNFAGDELTLFGTVEQDAASVGRAGGYALVATVTGPRRALVARKKERRLGIWVNRRSRLFPDAPSYLAVLANRPLDAIAAPEVLQRFRIGLQNVILSQNIRGDVVDAKDEYRDALVRDKTEAQLYLERANAVTFITPTLFRATVPLPANVSIGDYEVDVQLFVGGASVAKETTAFEIVKSGFEQQIAHAAREHSLLYGIATAILALFTGWAGSVVFRRD